MDVLSGDDCFRKLDEPYYILFYFTASWCGPCKRVYPDLLKIKKQLDPNDILIFKIDIDNDNDEFCSKCEIKNVPTVIIFKNRKALGKVIGSNLENIIKLIKDNVK